MKTKTEYRVRPVRRFVVTKFTKGKGGIATMGEFANENQASLAAQAFAKFNGGAFDAALAISNKHKVPQAQWRKWCPKAQETFNWLFELMFNDHRLFLHPKSPMPSEEGRKTTAWNAAWLAADAVRDALKGEVVAQKVVSITRQTG